MLQRCSTLHFLTVLLMLFGIAGCSGLEAPPELSEQEIFNTPEYKIAPLDRIQVFVWRSPELSVTVPVRPDGRISIPLIQDLQAAGKTPSELSSDVETALRPFVQNPKASVVVENFADSSAQAVQVLGEVRQPKVVPYRPHITALDAIVAAGGLTEFARGDGAKLIRRDSDGGGKTYRLELESLLLDGNIAKNVKLRPGDLIVVPQSLL